MASNLYSKDRSFDKNRMIDSEASRLTSLDNEYLRSSVGLIYLASSQSITKN